MTEPTYITDFYRCHRRVEIKIFTRKSIVNHGLTQRRRSGVYRRCSICKEYNNAHLEVNTHFDVSIITPNNGLPRQCLMGS